ncbi:MAG: NAD-dependent epimerase/dehydratase family protein [Chloroflexi bacterium]|nr:NAD-dependent epimerase/dehydratase family protein [Chloroflexota bacterium]
MIPMRQRWIITGANGYVGGELCKGLYHQGGTVLAVARVGKSLAHLEEMGISCHTYENMPSILSSGDVLVHCAGKVGNSGTWDEFLSVNRDWTESLFNQATECCVSCFIYISSIAALGYKNRPENETLDESSSPDHAKGELYGRSKWLAEQALQDRARNASTRLIVLRPGLIYGRRAFAASQTWLRRGVIVDPGQRVPLVHIDSFIEAVVRVVEHPGAHGVFLVVDEEQPVLCDLNAIKIRYGILQFAPWRIGKVGFWLLWLSRSIVRILRGRTGEVSKGHALAEYYFHTRRLRYSTQKLRSQVGWTSEVSLKDALKEWQLSISSESTGQ